MARFYTGGAEFNDVGTSNLDPLSSAGSGGTFDCSTAVVETGSGLRAYHFNLTSFGNPYRYYSFTGATARGYWAQCRFRTSTTTINTGSTEVLFGFATGTGGVLCDVRISQSD